MFLQYCNCTTHRLIICSLRVLGVGALCVSGVVYGAFLPIVWIKFLWVYIYSGTTRRSAIQWCSSHMLIFDLTRDLKYVWKVYLCQSNTEQQTKQVT